MAVPSAMVGERAGPFAHDVDARWAMAYAAAVGAADEPAFMDRSRPSGITVHPLFPVCLEWPAILALRDMAGHAMPKAEVARGVHVSHALELRRPIEPPQRLHTAVEVVGVQRTRPGALMTIRLDTFDDGGPVASTHQGLIYLGVDVEGPDRPATAHAFADPVLQAWSHGGAIEIEAGAAHVYTECSRIYNPIHTDPAVARGAGLPGIILHGTATLARAVTSVAKAAGVAAASVSAVRARFAGMVLMPSTLRFSATEPAPGDGNVMTIGFEVFDDAGSPVLDRACLEFSPRP